jgi:hypothetical protein
VIIVTKVIMTHLHKIVLLNRMKATKVILEDINVIVVAVMQLLMIVKKTIPQRTLDITVIGIGIMVLVVIMVIGAVITMKIVLMYLLKITMVTQMKVILDGDFILENAVIIITIALIVTKKWIYRIAKSRLNNRITFV